MTAHEAHPADKHNINLSINRHYASDPRRPYFMLRPVLANYKDGVQLYDGLLGTRNVTQTNT
jgi:hypothetical protein